MRLPAVVVLDPGTILKFDKIPSMLLAGMNIKRTTKQKWLIGCLSAAGVLVVLSGLAILVFFKVMDILKKVPPESTQIVLYNDTNELLLIDRIDYGQERVVIDADPVLAVREPGRFTHFSVNLWRDQLEMLRTLSVWYTGLSSGEQWRVDGVAQRLPDRPCKFVVFLRRGGGEVSSCGYNELQDFEGD